MIPSEGEIEARLAELRRQRDALDREIADHLLFLELGRRLRTPPPGAPEAAPDRMPGPPAGPGALPDPASGGAPAAASAAPRAPVSPVAHPVTSAARPAEAAPEPVSFEEDPVAARRYGRALVEAAVAVLGHAGRPMHAGEILERLVARGFTVPGHDPVAALNTRLWKRSGPGGPLRRLGDAVYDRADASP